LLETLIVLLTFLIATVAIPLKIRAHPVKSSTAEERFLTILQICNVIICTLEKDNMPKEWLTISTKAEVGM
jgi:hypothetical protein